ncbi:MAG: phosphonate metabolism protein, partial [Tabrizicola sp.]
MQRYAVYYAPREGAFAFRANDWLGREFGNPCDLPQPVLPGIGDPRGITAEPRRYGFHGTIRAPFRPAEGVDETHIRDTVAGLAAR